ncbi:MAG: AbrB/MazE/SpoVT family DNA-binding domain-containing protein [Bryobacteraceae bacterium]|jgi:bifunctional DNA-binding transcriptional regulator/antitoxin component of YhaV-PrlF toxin-antitoxin module
MPVVAVKNKYQGVIPQRLREELSIHRGDLLEARVERGKITYTPRLVLDRIPSGKAQLQQFMKQTREDAPGWLKKIWQASCAAVAGKLTMRQINAEIAAVRRERSRKTKQPAK